MVANARQDESASNTAGNTKPAGIRPTLNHAELRSTFGESSKSARKDESSAGTQDTNKSVHREGGG